MKSALLSAIGRPSAGKSSLVNLITGHKVSIVSAVPQTTRNAVRGICTEARGQLVILDTPGFHLSEKKFNARLKDVLRGSLEDIDLVLYVVDASRPPGEEEQAICAFLRPFRAKIVLVVNKIDLAPGGADAARAFVSETLGEVPACGVSARTGAGREALLDLIFSLAPEGEALYPEDFFTDQEPAFRITEIVRERVIAHTREEVPHSVYVEIADLEMQDEGRTLWVRGFICVERESQKGIIIGAGGEKIKSIVREAQAELGTIFPYKVALDFRVRVRPRWRSNDALLKKLIF